MNTDIIHAVIFLRNAPFWWCCATLTIHTIPFHDVRIKWHAAANALYSQKFMDTWPSYTYAALPQTVATFPGMSVRKASKKPMNAWLDSLSFAKLWHQPHWTTLGWTGPPSAPPMSVSDLINAPASEWAQILKATPLNLVESLLGRLEIMSLKQVAIQAHAGVVINCPHTFDHAGLFYSMKLFPTSCNMSACSMAFSTIFLDVSWASPPSINSSRM